MTDIKVPEKSFYVKILNFTQNQPSDLKTPKITRLRRKLSNAIHFAIILRKFSNIFPYVKVYNSMKTLHEAVIRPFKCRFSRCRRFNDIKPVCGARHTFL